uniref:Uncharacterized protein n=1 Tax=Anguilla anguilla TaxID=7936 RepID=A0A0E9VLH4_ANGAN
MNMKFYTRVSQPLTAP